MLVTISYNYFEYQNVCYTIRDNDRKVKGERECDAFANP